MRSSKRESRPTFDAAAGAGISTTQVQAGMRGLQLVYNSVSRLLVDLPDTYDAAPFPKGWAPDPDAFKAGLDLSTRELTAADQSAITQWQPRIAPVSRRCIAPTKP